jgi:hypothetical protein
MVASNGSVVPPTGGESARIRGVPTKPTQNSYYFSKSTDRRSSLINHQKRGENSGSLYLSHRLSFPFLSLRRFFRPAIFFAAAPLGQILSVAADRCPETSILFVCPPQLVYDYLQQQRKSPLY